MKQDPTQPCQEEQYHESNTNIFATSALILLAILPLRQLKLLVATDTCAIQTASLARVVKHLCLAPENTQKTASSSSANNAYWHVCLQLNLSHYGAPRARELEVPTDQAEQEVLPFPSLTIRSRAQKHLSASHTSGCAPPHSGGGRSENPRRPHWTCQTLHRQWTGGAARLG
eukprot:354785-Pelagomonas_calceolata.AAC.2